MFIHDESHKGHECSFCGKTFRWTTSLNSHIKAAHSVVFKSFECEDCGKVFKDPANFKAHCYTHSNVKPYNCTKCGKGFVRRDTWLTHASSCNVIPNR
jgi:KRAB domain-containing zinc finger protein